MTTQYGGTPADILITVDPTTHAVLAVPGGTAGVWTAATGGDPVTALVDGTGAAISHVTADSSGLYGFGAPDGLGTLWVDSGLPDGRRFPCNPTALGTLLEAVSGGAGDTAAIAELTEQVAGLTATQTAQGITLAGHTSAIGTLTDAQTAQAATITALQQAVADLQAAGGPPPPTASAPGGLTVTPGDTTAALTWTAPTDATAAITDYRISYRVDPSGPVLIFAHAASTALTQTITGLTNGTLYDVGVAAVMGSTVGAFAYSTVTPAAATPAAPRDLYAAVADGGARAVWYPAVGTSAPDAYRLEQSLTGADTWTTVVTQAGHTYTVTGLTNGTSYDFRVFAIVGGVDSAPSATSTVTPVPFDSADISHPATDIVLTPADGALAVTWTPTVDSAAVEGPGVRYRVSPGGDWVDVSTGVDRSPGTAAYTISGLTNGTAYDVEVFYFDGNDLPGDYSDPVTATPTA